MRVKVHHPSCEDYMTCLQRGGSSPFYSGTVMQRGYGIGGIFKTLGSALLPLLPKVGKFVAKTAMGVAADKMAGIPLSKSVKKRTMKEGKRAILNAISNSPRQPVATKRNKRSRVKSVKRIKTSDAFGTL